MRKLLSMSMVTVLVAVLLALTPGLAMADESDVSFELLIEEYVEEATLIQLATAEMTATVSSACVTSGSVSASFGLIVQDTGLAFGLLGFHEADFSATLDGTSYSGEMRGMTMVDENLMTVNMWGKFYDDDPDRLEGRYHVLGEIEGEEITDLALEITWKDGQQCYCDLNVDSFGSSWELGEEVEAYVEGIGFSFDGGSTGHYTGSFDGMIGGAAIWEGLGHEDWHGKGLVMLEYSTDTGYGALAAYAKREVYIPGVETIVKELSFLGAILELSAVGLEGSVNGGYLTLNILDPYGVPSGGGSGVFDIRHTHSDPCSPTPAPDGGGCFIATAAYGSYMDSSVETLRSFRDSYLVTNPAGQSLVSAYYKLSPPVAEFIDDHPALKPIVRAGLMPAVALSTVTVNTTLAQKIAIVGGLALVSTALAVWTTRRRSRGSTV